MLRYIVRRLLQTVIVLIFVTLFVFSIVRLAPGNPAALMLPEDASEEAIHKMEVKLGLDKPLYEQYFMYISGLLKGDLGTSTSYRLPVSKLIATRFPFTARLAVGAVIMGCILCIPLAIIAGANQGKLIDFFAVAFSMIGQSMASVWLAVFNIYLFSVLLGWFPALGTGGLKYMFLPLLTMAYPMAASITRVGRSGMIDTLSEDYITSTYAKGIKKSVVITKYAFRNAMIPIITLLGIQLGQFLTGAIIVESVFAWSGIGQLTFQAVGNRDYQLVQSLILISAALIAVINLIVDIINSFVDPRITLE